jgi:hypothetical protein
MDMTAVFFVPDFGLVSNVIAMPTIRAGRYTAVKDAVKERCRFLGLNDADSADCVNHAAKLLRRDRSGAVATSEGISMAKRIAQQYTHTGDVA